MPTRPTPPHPRGDTARRRRARRALTAAAVAAVTAACAPEGVRDSTTDPGSPQAAAIDGLFWYSVILGTVVWLVVLGLLAVPIVRSRRHHRGLDHATLRAEADAEGRRPHPAAGDGPPSATAPVGPASLRDRGGGELPAAEVDEPLLTATPAHLVESDADRAVRNRLIWVGGIIVPAVILVSLLVYASIVGQRTAHVPGEDDLVIDVVGHMFWWEIHYPDLDITTANEIVVPTGQQVRLNLTTEDVIHSFWMPRLHGKVDMIPGRENLMTFTATEVARHRGHCAEFCGVAHAQMVAFVDAVTPDDFDAWVTGQQQPAGPPASTEGERVFFDVGCAACHAVDGTDAVARVGPDLTHLATRGSLAAGIAVNDRENLERLIVDPWGLKPGNPMPPTPLTDEQLDALLDYLEGLEPQEDRS